MVRFEDAIVGELPWLRRRARRMVRDEDLAAELAQDVAERALRRGHGFAGRGPLRAWLQAILRNAAIDAFKRADRLPDLNSLDAGSEVGAPGLQEQALRCADIVSAVESLPPGRRAALVAEMSDEGDQAQRAATLGISLATYRTRVHRARQQMRARLRMQERLDAA